MQDGQADLRHNMLGCNEVDVVDPAHVLQLDEPLGELLGREIETVALVGYVVILGTALAHLQRRNKKQRAWQKTHRRLHPEKKTEPLPLCPWKQGSSDACQRVQLWACIDATYRQNEELLCSL
jgi:hypothetical protein